MFVHDAAGATHHRRANSTEGDAKGRLKRIAKPTAALSPLVLGAASPAYGCLVVPANETAAERSEQIAGESDPLW